MAAPDDQNRTLVMRAPGRPETPPAGEAVLLVIYGPSLGRRFLLGREEQVIGRSGDCAIAFDAESVSRRHARVVPVEGGYAIEDLGSTNGSFVNEQRVDRHTLVNTDVVNVGGVILKYLSGSDTEAAYHEEIYRLTILDGLTQVHNKRFFLEFLDREISRAQRHDTCLALVLFDIDDFKRVNDAYGHLAGDTVLKELSRRMRPRIRREDLLARYGGEEFACVLPDTTPSGAAIFAEALRIMVAGTPVRHQTQLIPVTISLGVAVTETAAHYDMKDLIRRADEKLYAAKRGGRNRAEI